MQPFKEFIAELFDRPWKLEPVSKGPLYDKVRNAVRHDYPGYNSLRVHKAEGDNGHVVEFAHNGAIEIHHIDKDGESGMIHVNTTKPNPRFMSTMFDRVKHHVLTNANPVRVVSTPRLFGHYQAAAKRLAGKHDVEVSEPKPHKHSFHSDTQEFTIKPKPKIDLK